VFQLILNELVATTGGALAAIFLDYDGETVTLACDRDLSDHDLRVIGAYQGIFLTRLRSLCRENAMGEPHRIKFDYTRHTVLSYELKDGYYVVLLVDHTANEGISWRRLERAREKLLAEM
jgi:hypothetical protein